MLLATLVRVPFHSVLLYRSRHSCDGKAGHDGRLPDPVGRLLQSVVIGLLGPNSIEKCWLEFWLEKPLEFWLQIPCTKKMFKNG